MVHLCDFVCVDDMVCGRRHSHLQHNSCMRKLRLARVLGGQKAVDLLELHPEVCTADDEEPSSPSAVVTADHNVWQGSSYGRAYSALVAASTSSMLGKDDSGQKYTRYSADHGQTWSKRYYDRSSSDSSAGSRSGDSQDLDGSGILSGLDSPITDSGGRSSSTPGQQLSSSLSSGASDIARHISFNESVEVQPIPPEGAGHSVADHQARSAEKKAEKKRARSHSGEQPSPVRRRLEDEETEGSVDTLVQPLTEMEVVVGSELDPQIPAALQIDFAKFAEPAANNEQVNGKFVRYLANNLYI